MITLTSDYIKQLSLYHACKIRTDLTDHDTAHEHVVRERVNLLFFQQIGVLFPYEKY